MSDTVDRVTTEFVVDDRTSSAIEKMAQSGEKLEHKFDHITHVFSEMAGAAGIAVGAFSFEEALRSSNGYMEQVRTISQVTGETVGKTDALLDTFSSIAGVSGPEAEMLITRMSRQMGRLSGHASYFATAMQNAGVKQGRGVVETFENMAAAAQKAEQSHGRSGLTFQKLQGILPLYGKRASDFYELLRAGPDAIKQSMEELQRSGTVLTPENIRAEHEMLLDQRKFASLWERVKLILVREINPALDAMLKYLNKYGGEITQWAQGFSNILRFGLTDGIRLASTLTKILAANAVLQRATGTGLVANTQRLGKWAFGGGGIVENELPVIARALAPLPQLSFTGKWAGRAEGMTVTESVRAYDAHMARYRMVPANSLNMGAAFGGTAMFKAISQFFEGATVFGRALSGIMKLTGVGLLIDRVLVGVIAVFKNTGGITDYLMETFNMLAGAWDLFWRPFDNMMTGVLKSLGIDSDFSNLWTNVIPLAVAGLMDTFTFILVAARATWDSLKPAFDVLAGQGWKATADAAVLAIRAGSKEGFFGSYYKDVKDIVDANKTVAKKYDPDQRTSLNFTGPIHIDMRFSDETEPDRIAVAFERRLSRAALGRVSASVPSGGTWG